MQELSKKLKISIGVLIKAGILFLLGFIVIVNTTILWRGANTNELSDLPPKEVVLVFGGGMVDGGTQTAMQEDRVKKGIEVYKAGKAEKIMFTGDDGGDNDDEVGAMKKQALAVGVPQEDILIDPHGYRTYLSCQRGATEYGLSNVIVVSQKFHLPRIIYLCERMGLKTVGASANLRDYGFDHTKIRIREVLARVKAFIEINITKP